MESWATERRGHNEESFERQEARDTIAASNHDLQPAPESRSLRLPFELPCGRDIHQVVVLVVVVVLLAAPRFCCLCCPCFLSFLRSPCRLCCPFVVAQSREAPKCDTAAQSVQSWRPNAERSLGRMTESQDVALALLQAPIGLKMVAASELARCN